MPEPEHDDHDPDNDNDEGSASDSAVTLYCGERWWQCQGPQEARRNDEMMSADCLSHTQTQTQE